MYKLSSVVVGAPIIVFLATFGLPAEAAPGGASEMPSASDNFATGREDRSRRPAESRKVDELARLLAKLQNDLAEMRDAGTAGSADLSEAQANLDAAKALLRQMTVLAAAPRSEAKATAAINSGFRELPIGAEIAIAGLKWAAQTQRVQVGPEGSYRFSAKAGERAAFDPPRKIRTELVGLTPFSKGQEIRLTGTFNIDPKSVFVGAEWCSIVQIHQADTRRADGSLVNASPMFSLDLLPDPATGRPYLQVRGETGLGEQTTYSPMRILGRLPDIELGRDHALDVIVVDGHGDRGRIAVWIDGRMLVDRADIPTGYAYVDLFADAYRVRGKPQPTTSYLKIGIYAGKGTGEVPPEAVNVALTFAEAAR